MTVTITVTGKLLQFNINSVSWLNIKEAFGCYLVNMLYSQCLYHLHSVKDSEVGGTSLYNSDIQNKTRVDSFFLHVDDCLYLF